MKKIIIILVLLVSTTWSQSKKEFKPVLYGYVQSWYQTDLSTNHGDFLIRYARLGVKGRVNEFAGYKLFVDFTRLGRLKTKTAVINGTSVVTSAEATFSNYLLDADVYLSPVKNFKIDLGQFKVPFGTDNLRSAASIDFINRPLITNVSPGLRDIGVLTSYNLKDYAPLEISAGLFNGTGQNKPENDRTTNFAARAATSPIKGLGISANYYGGKLSGGNVNMYNFGFDFQLSQLFIDGEFGGEGLDNNISTINSNSYFIYSYYDFEFDQVIISHIIPAVRYEHFDPNTSISNDEINRTTIGLSLELAKIKFAQFRVNYELFDYKDGSTNPNKITAAILTRF